MRLVPVMEELVIIVMGVLPLWLGFSVGLMTYTRCRRMGCIVMRLGLLIVGALAFC